MAASPVTGEWSAGFRRSSSQFASIPQRSLSFHEKVGLAKDDAAANVLYLHPSVRIYTFQPPTDALQTLDKTKKTLPDADYPIDAIEILPWRARTETLAAQGKLMIEKVQGSVHFLKAGDLIHSIMKNSQCWCVDGESKFVMRVGRLKYQRIEMPNVTAEDKKKVEEFKDVIGRILKFEKTPCPFIRAFHVDLPDDAITPRRRGTWKRKESLTATTAEEEARPLPRTKTARTMSMRAMPPSAFPSRSLTQLDMERPRTASTPTSTGRFSFPDMRTESPTTYSAQDNTDSDHHDSESDRPETGHSSEMDESDRESANVPIPRSPLNQVETLSSAGDDNTARGQHPPKGNDVSVENDHLPVPAWSGPLASLSEYQFSAPKVAVEPRLRQADPSPRNTSNDLAPADGRNDDLISGATEQEPETSENANIPPSNAEALESQTQNASQIESIVANPESSANAGTGNEEPSYQVDLSNSLRENSVKKSDIEGGRDAKAQTEAPITSPVIGTSMPIIAKEADPNLFSNELTRSVTNDDNESIVSSDSFHTLLSDDGLSSPRHRTLGTRPFAHRRELSETTVTAASIDDGYGTLPPQTGGSPGQISSFETSDPSDPSDPDHAWPERRPPGAFTDEPELRRRLSRGRSFSPPPPAAILQSPSLAEHGSPIPGLLLQKAATLAVVKPIEVIVFVMQVLARIAGGATMNDLVSGDLFRRPGVRRTASGTFGHGMRGTATARDSDDEDDFGVPVHGRRKSSGKENQRPEMDDAASLASID